MLMTLFHLFGFILQDHVTRNPSIRFSSSFHRPVSFNRPTPNSCGSFIQDIAARSANVELWLDEAEESLDKMDKRMTSMLESATEYEGVLQKIKKQQFEMENELKKATELTTEEYTKYATKHQKIEQRLFKIREGLEQGLTLLHEGTEKYVKRHKQVGEQLPKVMNELGELGLSVIGRTEKYGEGPQLIEEQLPQIKAWLKETIELLLEEASEPERALRMAREKYPRMELEEKDKVRV